MGYDGVSIGTLDTLLGIIIARAKSCRTEALPRCEKAITFGKPIISLARTMHVTSSSAL